MVIYFSFLQYESLGLVKFWHESQGVHCFPGQFSHLQLRSIFALQNFDFTMTTTI